MFASPTDFNPLKGRNHVSFAPSGNLSIQHAAWYGMDFKVFID